MSEQKYQQTFVQELIQRGYSKKNIYEEIDPIEPKSKQHARMDIVIHDGNVILQAFEIKRIQNNISRDGIMQQCRIYKQSFATMRIDVPIYVVLYDNQNHFEIFDENLNLIQDVDTILNFDYAKSKILKIAEDSISSMPKSLFYICHSAALLLLLCTSYCYYHCGCNLFCYDNLSSFCISIILIIAPILLKMRPQSFKIQLGICSLAIEMSKEYQPHVVA